VLEKPEKLRVATWPVTWPLFIKTDFLKGMRKKPLENLPPHSVKYFAVSELLELVKDKACLVKVTNALNQHWQKRNERKRNQLAGALI
jgi:hypothetical protein